MKRRVGLCSVFLLFFGGGCGGGGVSAVPGDSVAASDVVDAHSVIDAEDAQPTVDGGATPMDLGGASEVGAQDVGCAGGSTRCEGMCVSLARDNAHCGACGNACAAGERCEEGRCTLTCAAGTTRCERDGGAAQCVDLQRDGAHCGACGNACAAGTVCMNGSCGPSCGALTRCDASCRDLTLDPANCGACGRVCPAGQLCLNGQCGCDGARVLCMVAGTPTCVDRDHDSRHCGACDNACAAGSRCEAGRCVQTCPTGQQLCGDVCTDVRSTPEHCGSCGFACPSTPNRPPVCIDRICGQGACNTDFADCDTDFRNGCEANLRTSAQHCGRCGASCGTPRFGTASCVNGSCQITCEPEMGNCDGNYENGCETDLQYDVRHCGACGNACVAGQGCRRGQCVSLVGTIGCVAAASLSCQALGGTASVDSANGLVVCRFGNVSSTDYCGQSCNTYRVFPWRNGGRFPACASHDGVMLRGRSYTSPRTCGCDQPPVTCSTWILADCVGT